MEHDRGLGKASGLFAPSPDTAGTASLEQGQATTTTASGPSMFHGLRWKSTGPPQLTKMRPHVTSANGRSVFEPVATSSSSDSSSSSTSSTSSSDALASDAAEAAAVAARLAESLRLEGEARRLGEDEGQWDAAFEAWAAAAELTPDRAGPHEGRARAALRMAQPRPRLALRAAGQAAYLDPASPQAFLTLGRAQLACDEPVLALRSFHTVLRLEPTHATLHEDLTRAERLVHQQRLQAQELEAQRLEREAERIQLELKRKKDRRRAAAERWYADRRAREEAGRQGAVAFAGQVDDLRADGGGDDDDDGEEEEEEELEEGYSREEWARLREVLETQGGELMHDFQAELARKRQQDREERLREREEEVEEDDDEEEEKTT